MKIPCKDCISLAICRHKEYVSLFTNCALLQEYEPHFERLDIRSQTKLRALSNTLKPTSWDLLRYDEVDERKDDPRLFVRTRLNRSFLSLKSLNLTIE